VRRPWGEEFSFYFEILFQPNCNSCYNGINLCQDFIVGESENVQILRFEEVLSDCICFELSLVAVSVYFNDQGRIGAKKINHIVTDRPLAEEPYAKLFSAEL